MGAIMVGLAGIFNFRNRGASKAALTTREEPQP
jgi:hypothetical protein